MKEIKPPLHTEPSNRVDIMSGPHKYIKMAHVFNLGFLPPATSFFSILSLRIGCFVLNLLLAVYFLFMGVFALIILPVPKAIGWIFGAFSFICLCFYLVLANITFITDKNTRPSAFKKMVIYWSTWISFGIFFSFVIFALVICFSITGESTFLLPSFYFPHVQELNGK